MNENEANKLIIHQNKTDIGLKDTKNQEMH